MLLTEVCSINTGYTARGQLVPTEHGGVLAIQLRDIPANGDVTAERLTRFTIDDVVDRYLVRAGDVVFRSRGERNTASALDKSFSEPAVAVLPLMILRPRPDVVTPQYLAWIINQAPAQRHFESAAQGTSLRMVSRTSLETLAIAVPDFETQQRILQLDALAEHERELAQQLNLKRHEMIRRVLIEHAQEQHTISGNERMPK